MKAPAKKASTKRAPKPVKSGIDSIEAVLRDLRAGKPVIVVDDADRENEGDLIIAAEKATAENINFLVTYGRGMVCAPITHERAAKLGLNRMVLDNRESFKTDFTVTVDAAHGITTGISAEDRAKTIRLLANPKSVPGDLVQPGHIFPLRAKAGGVLQRSGHTEAAVDLARMAGPGPLRRPVRNHERRRHDGAPARPAQVQEKAQAQALHDPRFDRTPAPPRKADRAGAACEDADRLRYVRFAALPRDDEPGASPRAGEGRCLRRQAGAGARA